MQSHAFQWQGFKFEQLIISWKVVKLTLRRTFTTAHSSSDTRSNFFFRISHEDIKEKGYGECGLPPKKKLCYLADVVDCQTFALRLRQKLLDNQEKMINLQLNQFKYKLLENIPPAYFRYFYEENINDNQTRKIITNVLNVLYWAYQIKQPSFKAAISGLEFSLLDFFAKYLQVSLTDFIFSPQDIKNKEAYSFYTLSYQKQAAKMIENAQQFLQFTSYIKIKYVDNIYELLTLMIQLQQIAKDRIKGYIIDANASWKVESFRQFNQEITSSKYDIIRSKTMYIEQPFPIQMDKSELQQWKQLKKQSKIKIMVDQSFSSYQQVQQASSLGNAINIKSEKAGGPINCIRSYLYAQKYNMQVVLGSMVSTHLGSNQTYCLYPLTKWLDVDGSLLVQSPDLSGGFQWGAISTLKKPQNRFFGLEIDTNKLE